MEKDVVDFLTEAINAVYKDIVVESYNFDLEEEVYDIELFHKDSKKTIRIGFRDNQKRRDFDVIPLHAMNAPLGLLEIFASFLGVYWNAKKKGQTMHESLSELVSDTLQEIAEKFKDEEEEKLVH